MVRLLVRLVNSLPVPASCLRENHPHTPPEAGVARSTPRPPRRNMQFRLLDLNMSHRARRLQAHRLALSAPAAAEKLASYSLLLWFRSEERRVGKARGCRGRTSG